MKNVNDMLKTYKLKVDLDQIIDRLMEDALIEKFVLSHDLKIFECFNDLQRRERHLQSLQRFKKL